MTLSRSTPLPSHDFPDQGQVRTCGDCGAVWNTSEYDDPPPWPCKREPLERTSRLSPVSKSNSGREHQKDSAYREWIRDLPCILQRSGAARCEGRIDPAHVKNWGAGWGDFIEIVEDGEAVRVGNIVPLCRKHHRLSENEPGWGPETFEKHYGISLAGEARRLGERWRGRG